MTEDLGHDVIEDQVVTADLRREQVAIETTGQVTVDDAR